MSIIKKGNKTNNIMIKYLNKITDDWRNLDRIEALIINNKNIYREDNHQYCMMEMCKTYWDDKGIDVYDYDGDGFEAATEITNDLFWKNELSGYDVFINRKENKRKGDKKLLVAHYPQNIEKDWDVVVKLAEDEGMMLCAFIDSVQGKLGKEVWEVGRVEENNI